MWDLSQQTHLGRAQARQEAHKPKGRSTKPLLQDPGAVQGCQALPAEVGLLLLHFPFPGHQQPLVQPLGSPELLLPALSGPNQGIALGKAKHRKGRGKNDKK